MWTCSHSTGTLETPLPEAGAGATDPPKKSGPTRPPSQHRTLSVLAACVGTIPYPLLEAGGTPTSDIVAACVLSACRIDTRLTPSAQDFRNKEHLETTYTLLVLSCRQRELSSR
jgi:hypothetical protein